MHQGKLNRLIPISASSGSIYSVFIMDGVNIDGLEEMASLILLTSFWYSFIMIRVDLLGKEPGIFDKGES